MLICKITLILKAAIAQSDSRLDLVAYAPGFEDLSCLLRCD